MRERQSLLAQDGRDTSDLCDLAEWTDYSSQRRRYSLASSSIASAPACASTAPVTTKTRDLDSSSLQFVLRGISEPDVGETSHSRTNTKDSRTTGVLAISPTQELTRSNREFQSEPIDPNWIMRADGRYVSWVEFSKLQKKISKLDARIGGCEDKGQQADKGLLNRMDAMTVTCERLKKFAEHSIAQLTKDLAQLVKCTNSNSPKALRTEVSHDSHTTIEDSMQQLQRSTRELQQSTNVARETSSDVRESETTVLGLQQQSLAKQIGRLTGQVEGVESRLLAGLQHVQSELASVHDEHRVLNEDIDELVRQLDLLEMRCSSDVRDFQSTSESIRLRTGSGTSVMKSCAPLTPVKEEPRGTDTLQLAQLTAAVAAAASQDTVANLEKRLQDAIERSRNEIEGKLAALSLSVEAASNGLGKSDGIEGSLVMTVRCPEGIGVGDTLAVTSPHGEETVVTVPEGIEEGMEFDVTLGQTNEKNVLASESLQVWNCARHCAAFDSRLAALEDSANHSADGIPAMEAIERLQTDVAKMEAELENLQFQSEEHSGRSDDAATQLLELQQQIVTLQNSVTTKVQSPQCGQEIAAVQDKIDNMGELCMANIDHLQSAVFSRLTALEDRHNEFLACSGSVSPRALAAVNKDDSGQESCTSISLEKIESIGSIVKLLENRVTSLEVTDRIDIVESLKLDNQKLAGSVEVQGARIGDQADRLQRLQGDLIAAQDKQHRVYAELHEKIQDTTEACMASDSQITDLESQVAQLASQVDDHAATCREMKTDLLDEIKISQTSVQSGIEALEEDTNKRFSKFCDHTMSVEIPEGVTAGDTLVVTAPDGSETEVQVPPGLEVGMHFDVTINHGDSHVPAAVAARFTELESANNKLLLFMQDELLQKLAADEQLYKSAQEEIANLKVETQSHFMELGSKLELLRQHSPTVSGIATGMSADEMQAKINEASNSCMSSIGHLQAAVFARLTAVEDRHEELVSRSKLLPGDRTKNSGSNGEITMAITVPAGVHQGDTITVTSEDGQEVDVEVPEGLHEGMTFDVTVRCDDPTGATIPMGLESRFRALESTIAELQDAQFDLHENEA
eukprot:SAG31_NODE_3040_length_4754_cov_3.587970_2_plen_1084_part_00